MKTKKGTIISISLIVLGLVLECLYLGSDKIFFAAKFWLIGLICFVAGVLGLFLFGFSAIDENFSRPARENDSKEK